MNLMIHEPLLYKTESAAVHTQRRSRSGCAARIMNAAFSVRRKAPATCGELVQGAIDGQDFLVNCPIDRFVGASVRPCGEAGIHITRPAKFAKVQAALALWNPMSDHQGGLEVTLHGDVPRGKGMASSSADLAAALTAVSVALGRPG